MTDHLTVPKVNDIDRLRQSDECLVAKVTLSDSDTMALFRYEDSRCHRYPILKTPIEMERATESEI